jgi:hypothetical protein
MIQYEDGFHNYPKKNEINKKYKLLVLFNFLYQKSKTYVSILTKSL